MDLQSNVSLGVGFYYSFEGEPIEDPYDVEKIPQFDKEVHSYNVILSQHNTERSFDGRRR